MGEASPFLKDLRSAGGVEPVARRSFRNGLASPSCYMVREDRDYTLIVRLFVMHNSRSGSLTNRNGCRNSLTPRDLKNHCFGLLSVNYTGAVKFSSPKDSPIDQDHAHQVWFLDSGLRELIA